MLGFLLCIKGIKNKTQRFWLCSVDFCRPYLQVVEFYRPMHLRSLPETAENFGGIEYGITGKKIL